MDLPPSLAGGKHEAFARSVLAGLSHEPKYLEPRWLYDAVGAKLFEAITLLDHYYPTRTETALLEAAAPGIADALGEGVTIVEPGSGEALKVRPLLAALGERAIGYVPIDIAEEQLARVASEMSALYPHLDVTPVAADFFGPFTTPPADNAVVFFPGSTVGNMLPEAAARILRALLQCTGAQRVLIGFDLVKDIKTLEDAYDDPAGVTAAFKKNLLQRMNRELGGTFDLSKFDFVSRWDADKAAIHMELVANEATSAEVAGQLFTFDEGEAIHTEDSRKFTVPRFTEFARTAGLEAVEHWTDEGDNFAVMLLRKVD